jgi:hypothetical protein
VKQNLLDRGFGLGIDYYAASRIVDGVALMTDLSIWRGGSGNTKLKLHVHLPTFCTQQNTNTNTKHKTQTQNTKHKTQLVISWPTAGPTRARGPNYNSIVCV